MLTNFHSWISLLKPEKYHLKDSWKDCDIVFTKQILHELVDHVNNWPEHSYVVWNKDDKDNCYMGLMHQAKIVDNELWVCIQWTDTGMKWLYSRRSKYYAPNLAMISHDNEPTMLLGVLVSHEPIIVAIREDQYFIGDLYNVNYQIM